MVDETYDTYQNITLPFIEENNFSLTVCNKCTKFYKSVDMNFVGLYVHFFSGLIIS